MRWELFKKKRENPFDALLSQALHSGKFRFLILWNRGLGDIPLGLYALIVRIRFYIPHAEITFLTRPDLYECFTMLARVNVVALPTLVRGEKRAFSELIKEAGLKESDFDLLIEKADPTRWLSWQLGALIPKLQWNPAWDALTGRFNIPSKCIGAHIQSETAHFYGYRKDWPLDSWIKLIEEMYDETFLLFGTEKKESFALPNLIDLRGETSLFEMLSLIKNCCHTLIAPDSGILSVLYYVASDFPIKVISLWADPHQGVLRQDVPSPNCELQHIPVLGRRQKVAKISLKTVKKAVRDVHRSSSCGV